MFDFDDLEGESEPKAEAAEEELEASAAPAEKEAAASEAAEPTGGSADAAAGAADPATKAVTGQLNPRPNAQYSVGMHLENVGYTVMRKGEDKDSDTVARLSPDTRVEITAIGTDATGNRIQVRTAEPGGQEGWVSVISQNSASLWRECKDLKAENGTPAKQSDQIEQVKQFQQQRPDHGKPTARFNVGDMVEATGTLIVRAGEPLESLQLKRLPCYSRLRVVKIGTGPTGKRLQVCDDVDQIGWVSAVGADGLDLLKVIHREGQQDEGKEKRERDGDKAETVEEKQPDVALFAGEGRSLGGTSGSTSSANPRAAALAAAEQRQASNYAHGISDKKAEEMKEKERRELLIAKITEIYTLKGEEVPLPIKSAGSKSLQKHLDFLQGKSSMPQSAAPPALQSQQQTPSTTQAAPALKTQPPTSTPAPAPSPAPAPAPAPSPAAATPSPAAATPSPASAAAAAPSSAQGARKAFSSQLLQNQVQRTGFTSSQAGGRDNRQAQDLAAGVPGVSQQASPTLPERQQAVANSALQNAATMSPEERRRELMQQAQYHFGLNQEQLQAVLDLECMGFDYGQALEAFLSCERDQEMAVNFLLEQQQGDEAEVAAAATASQPAAVAAQQVLDLQPGAKVNAEDIFLSLAEWEAVRRIEELGFDRDTSLRAYLHFDRDEEAAGNLLLM
mmetsp:Transcript_155693/g.298759  ORF Transcript_155693/g.298759 Transcript_155693/m.298759 type:complete len:677 (-) Transcript_155693:109-2139(-)